MKIVYSSYFKYSLNLFSDFYRLSVKIDKKHQYFAIVVEV